MLSFNRHQVATIGRGSFVQRMRQVLTQRFPADASLIASALFEQQVLELVQRAQRYGLCDEQSAAIFVVTAWLLGTDFDTRWPDLHAMLVRPDLLALQKSAALEAFATNLLQHLGTTVRVAPEVAR